MRMLVTGGAGFIGANFVHQTLRDHPEYEVVVLDALTYAGNEASLAPVRGDVEFVQGSVADSDLVDRLVAGCDVVVHFVAKSHNDNSMRDPWPFVQTNWWARSRCWRSCGSTASGTTTSPSTRSAH